MSRTQQYNELTDPQDNDLLGASDDSATNPDTGFKIFKKLRLSVLRTYIHSAFASFTSSTALPATSQKIRLANNEGAAWRNAGNTDNISLYVSALDQLVVKKGDAGQEEEILRDEGGASFLSILKGDKQTIRLFDSDNIIPDQSIWEIFSTSTEFKIRARNDALTGGGNAIKITKAGSIISKTEIDEGIFLINDTTQSTDKDTGAMVINGGAGIEKTLNVGEAVNAASGSILSLNSRNLVLDVVGDDTGIIEFGNTALINNPDINKGWLYGRLEGGSTKLFFRDHNGTEFDLLDGVSNHSQLSNLLVDTHTQYALLAGRAGGQALIGGNAAGNSLTLRSTSNATKGNILIDEDTNSTSNITGALAVAGGVGISKDTFIGWHDSMAKLVVDGTINSRGYKPEVVIQKYIENSVDDITTWHPRLIIDSSAYTGTAWSFTAYADDVEPPTSQLRIGAALENAIVIDEDGGLINYTEIANGLLKVLDTTEATNTLTGALQVGGGAGIVKNLHVGGTINAGGVISSGGDISSGGAISSEGDITGKGILKLSSQLFPKISLIAEQETPPNQFDILCNGEELLFNSVVSAVSTTVFRINRAFPSNALSTIFDNGKVHIKDTTPVSPNDGALIVDGGAYIEKSVLINSTLDVYGTIEVWNSGNLSLDNGGIYAGVVTEATSTTTGAIQTEGGIGINKSVYAGGNITSQGYMDLKEILAPAMPSATFGRLYVRDNGTKSNLYFKDDAGVEHDLLAGGGGGGDHGGLTGLSDDDHSIYALLAGRTGGQTLIGGNAAGNDLVLQSTSNASKGKVSISETTEATSASTGALQVAGGVGIAKSLYIGGDLDRGGFLSKLSSYTGVVDTGVFHTISIPTDTTAYIEAKVVSSERKGTGPYTYDSMCYIIVATVRNEGGTLIENANDIVRARTGTGGNIVFGVSGTNAQFTFDAEDSANGIASIKILTTVHFLPNPA